MKQLFLACRRFLHLSHVVAKCRQYSEICHSSKNRARISFFVFRTRLFRRAASLFLTAALLIVPYRAVADGTGEWIPAGGTPMEFPGHSAAACVVMEVRSGQVLYETNADTPMMIASTTKIMTAILAIELCDLTRVITIPKQAVGIEGSSAYLYEGEQLTMEDLLYALMLQSANDAAVAIALAVDGDVALFADRMNEKAEALGMTSSHFVNPNGLPADGHQASARDMAKLTAYALQNETFRTIVSTVKYSVKEGEKTASHLFVNHNRLLRTYDGAIGVKTGYTKQGGRSLVSAAQRDGVTLVCVTLSDPNDWRDHASLLDWGFSLCQYKVALQAQSFRSVIHVVGATDGVQELTLTNESTIDYISTDGRTGDVTDKICMPDFIYAPAKAGDRVGSITYYRDGEEIGTSDLVLTQSVDAEVKKRGFAAFWEKLMDWLLPSRKDSDHHG